MGLGPARRRSAYRNRAAGTSAPVVAEALHRAAADVLGWPGRERWDRWAAVLKTLGDEPQSDWTAGLLRGALAAAAGSAGKTVAELIAGVGTKLAADVERLPELIAGREGEEGELAGRMTAERARAAAAALYADERAAATVAKVERHLGRELERALRLLRGLQAARQDRDDRVGDVIGGVLELNVVRNGLAALAEGRGSGSLVAFSPAADD